MMCMMYESYGIGCADIVCIIYIHYVTEEGTRIARAECEDGAISIYPEEGTRIVRAECEDGAIYIYLHLYND